MSRGKAMCVKVETQYSSKVCRNLLCHTQGVNLYNIPFKICLSRLHALHISCSSSLLVYRMFHCEVQNSSGDGVGAASSTTAAEANHLWCPDSCSHPPSAEPQSRVRRLHAGDATFDGAKFVVLGPHNICLVCKPTHKHLPPTFQCTDHYISDAKTKKRCKTVIFFYWRFPPFARCIMVAVFVKFCEKVLLQTSA